MEIGLIVIGILLGIVLGLASVFFLIKFKNYLLKKNALKIIKEQNLKFKVNGKPLDFAEKIEKEMEKNKKKKEIIKEKKLKKVRVRKK